jgi:hypothetical protein
MMLVFRWFAIGALTLFVAAVSASAQQTQCTIAEAQRAESEAETLRSWDDLYRSYKRYRQCDDGAIWEGYSESVARILVDHWVTLPRFAQLADNEEGFRGFVLKHVDETINGEDARTIRANAQHACPSRLRRLCHDLMNQANPQY